LAVVTVATGSSTDRAPLPPWVCVTGTTMPNRALLVTVGSGSAALWHVSPYPDP
jgi:hypothetical protein